VPALHVRLFIPRDEFAANAVFFVMGRAPYRLKDLLQASYPSRKARAFFGEPCLMPFLRPLHNHFDNYGNYVPGFCAGISLGDVRELDRLLKDGIDTERHPVLGFLIDEDIQALFEFARNLGYEEAQGGYLSKCHLCMDARRHLALKGGFKIPGFRTGFKTALIFLLATLVAIVGTLKLVRFPEKGFGEI